MRCCKDGVTTYVDAEKDDVIIIKSPVGMPGRAIKNDFINDINLGKKKQIACPYHCILTCDYTKSPYCIVLALINAQKGKLKNGFAFAGKTVYKIKEIISVKKLMATLLKEYKNVIRLHIGLEDPELLIDDLKNAFNTTF